MNTAAEAALSERRMVAAGLRGSAAGDCSAEAAVELLVRAFGGRLADPGWPWIREGAELGVFWLDHVQLIRSTSLLCSSERGLARIIVALASSGSLILADALVGLDRPTLTLVLAAVAHATGSAVDNDALFPFVDGLSPLVEWPADELDQLDRPALALPQLKMGAVR